MEFKIINLIYIGLWIFNLLSYFIALRANELYNKKTILDNIPFLYFIMKWSPFSLMILSLIISIVTIFLSYDLTMLFIKIYYLLSILNLSINMLIYSLKKQ